MALEQDRLALSADHGSMVVGQITSKYSAWWRVVAPIWDRLRLRKDLLHTFPYPLSLGDLFDDGSQKCLQPSASWIRR
jgi:hypothetical protein